MEEKYDCKYIYISRNIDDQANSLMRIWKQHEERAVFANRDFLIPWLTEWGMFCKQLLSHLNIRYHSVDFDELISDKVTTTNKIASFTNCENIDNTAIDRWIIRNQYNDQS